MKHFFAFCFLILIFPLITAKNDPHCGTKSPIESKIIGGKEATPHEFPWMTSFGYTKQKGSDLTYKTWCGGSIIHPQFILTAAHCYKIMSNKNIRATVGKCANCFTKFTF